MSLKCPKCGVYAPDSTRVCDCGYNFSTGVEPDDAKRRRFEKRGGAVGAVVGFLLPAAIEMAWRGGGMPGAETALVNLVGLLVGYFVGKPIGREIGARLATRSKA